MPKRRIKRQNKIKLGDIIKVNGKILITTIAVIGAIVFAYAFFIEYGKSSKAASSKYILDWSAECDGTMNAYYMEHDLLSIACKSSTGNLSWTRLCYGDMINETRKTSSPKIMKISCYKLQ